MPVFARTTPRAGRLRIRCSSVPVSPATGRAGTTYGRRSGSSHIVRRRVASAPVVQRSISDRPEPSTMRTPERGTPAAVSSRRVTASPAAAEPPLPCTAPTSFISISA